MLFNKQRHSILDVVIIFNTCAHPSLGPQLESDLSGSISMLAQTGPFTIPVRCLTKKCIIAVDSVEVDFGKVCVGETIRRSVAIRNSGALPTHFQLMPLAPQADAAQVRDDLSWMVGGEGREEGGREEGKV